MYIYIYNFFFRKIYKTPLTLITKQNETGCRISDSSDHKKQESTPSKITLEFTVTEPAGKCSALSLSIILSHAPAEFIYRSIQYFFKFVIRILQAIRHVLVNFNVKISRPSTSQQKNTIILLIEP